jgi:hypothetical protein
MIGNTKELLYSRNVVEFATVAKEYCAFIDNISSYDRTNFVKIAGKLIPLLYYKATLLPSNEPFYEEGNKKFVTEELYESTRYKIKRLLRQFDDFPEVFDVRIAETDEPFNATISEYMADVYQDLKNFTTLYQTGQLEEMNDALWECHLNFKDFWGIRLANTLRALHILNSSDIDLATDAEDELSEQNEVSPRDTKNWIISQRQNEND